MLLLGRHVEAVRAYGVVLFEADTCAMVSDSSSEPQSESQSHLDVEVVEAVWACGVVILENKFICGARC